MVHFLRTFNSRCLSWREALVKLLCKKLNKRAVADSFKYFIHAIERFHMRSIFNNADDRYCCNSDRTFKRFDGVGQRFRTLEWSQTFKYFRAQTRCLRLQRHRSSSGRLVVKETALWCYSKQHAGRPRWYRIERQRSVCYKWSERLWGYWSNVCYFAEVKAMTCIEFFWLFT